MASQLAKGDEYVKMELLASIQSLADPFSISNWTFTIYPSWNELFAATAPALLEDASDVTLKNRLAEFLRAIKSKAGATINDRADEQEAEVKDDQKDAE